jgi:hypothetical protein
MRVPVKEKAASYINTSGVDEALANAMLVKSVWERHEFDSDEKFKEHQDYWEEVIDEIYKHVK